MYNRLKNTLISHRNPPMNTEVFGPWPGGLVTAVYPEQMKRDQLYKALNVIQVRNGFYRTRDGSTLVTTVAGCTGEVVCIKDIKVGATWYTIISDDDNKLYKMVSGTATAIATLEGEAQFFAFMGLLIITDGSYIKAWNGTSVYMLYDNGSGTSAYQVNKRDATPTTDKPLGNGTVTSVTYTFSTQAWTAGYTIPPTHIYATMYKVLAPTGTVLAKIKRTSDDAVMASKAISTTVADFTAETTGLEYEAIFTSSDITIELSPSTSYYISLEYSGGDAANYVMVKAIDASNPQVSLKPGRPPKAVFGLVAKGKIFSIEGTDGTNPGYGWYCAAGNHLDWSTANSGGYFGAIDASATNYPVGSIAVWNDEVWFFGTPRQPFMGKLSGATPSAYIISDTMQKVSAHYKSTISTPDDIYFLHPGGVDSISSVQEYGDVKAVTQTEDIKDKIHLYFSSAAVAGYDPNWGIYLLKLDGTDYTYAIHTRAKDVRYIGKKGYSFSPATQFEYAFAGGVTCYGDGNGYAYIGTDDGNVYKIDKDVVDDDSTAVTYGLITPPLNTIFGEANAKRINMTSFAQYGATFNFKFYRNHSRVSFLTLSSTLPVDYSTLTLDVDILTADADFLTIPTEYFDRYNVNFNFRDLSIGIEDITLGQDRPMFFGPVSIVYTSVRGL